MFNLDFYTFFERRTYLEKLQKLALLKKEGISYKIKMDNEEVRISSDSLITNINEVLGCKYEAYGSLEGKLQTISSRAGLNFILYEALTDKPVRCTLKDDLLSTALRSFNKRVYVFVRFESFPGKQEP